MVRNKQKTVLQQESGKPTPPEQPVIRNKQETVLQQESAKPRAGTRAVDYTSQTANYRLIEWTRNCICRGFLAVCWRCVIEQNNSVRNSQNRVIYSPSRHTAQRNPSKTHHTLVLFYRQFSTQCEHQNYFVKYV